jgi:hypothetical protein
VDAGHVGDNHGAACEFGREYPVHACRDGLNPLEAGCALQQPFGQLEGIHYLGGGESAVQLSLSRHVALALGARQVGDIVDDDVVARLADHPHRLGFHGVDHNDVSLLGHESSSLPVRNVEPRRARRDGGIPH